MAPFFNYINNILYDKTYNIYLFNVNNRIFMHFVDKILVS